MIKVRDESVEDIKAMAEGRLEERHKIKEEQKKEEIQKVSQTSMDSLEKIKNAFEKYNEPPKETKPNDTKETWVAILIAIGLLIVYIAIQIFTISKPSPPQAPIANATTA